MRRTDRLPMPMLASLALLAICAFADDKTPRAPDAGASGTKLSDRQIGDAVEDEIMIDPAVMLAGIEVTTSRGVVTLKGRVPDLLAKERAVRLAETVRGVRSIVDRLQVNPPESRTDAEIAADAREALLRDPATEFFDVAVKAEGGKVTLTGTVQSWAEKELCGTVTKHVHGVRALEISQDLRERLDWDVYVDDGLIDVRVENGAVTLSGTVGSAAERSRTIRECWVAGVKSVDAEALEVARWARDPDLRANKYVVRDNEQIQDAIDHALTVDPRVYSFDVDAEVDAGVVTLRGIVGNLKAKRSAYADARNTVGVRTVVNRVRVRSERGSTDAAIARDVRRALLRDPWVDRYEISVSVRNGVAHLYGRVDSYFEKAQADDIAATVSGVIDVANRLEVANDGVPHPYDPYVDPWMLDQYAWYHWSPAVVRAGSDADIYLEIENELFWSPYVNEDDVKVTVEDGIATLTGTVDTLAESEAAMRNAYEGGAVYVRNDLRVQ